MAYGWLLQRRTVPAQPYLFGVVGYVASLREMRPF